MPSYAEHEKFVDERPYRWWYLVRPKDGMEYVGDIHVTTLNEIGLFIFERHRGKGYGEKALQLFMARHRPLYPIPARRIGKWLANIAPENFGGATFFRRFGFTKIQETYIHG